MGMFFPCLLAAILNGLAMQIFREPMKVGDGPLMALYMFIFTTFLLLWSIRLYPSNLRRIGKMQFLIEFLAAEFVMEDLIIDFWFPLEKGIIEFLPALAKVLEDWLEAGDFTADPLIDFLKNDSNGYIISYLMATFFLVAALHATRFFDLRTLTQEGPRCFCKEIAHKTRLAKRRVCRKIGFGNKKVKINENKNVYQNGQSCGLSNESPNQDGDMCSLSHIGTTKKMRSMKLNSSKNNKYCPLHNPCPKDDCDNTGSYSEFEDLGKYSDLECS